MVWPSGVTPPMPGLPGVTSTSAVRPSTRARACSRPPGPDHADGPDGGRSSGTAHAAKRTNWSRPGPTPTRRTGVTDLLGQEVHVVPGGLGQVADLGGPGDVGLPAGHLLVDRCHLVEDGLVVRRVGEALAVGLVGHAHLDRVEGVQHVELGQGHLGQRVEPDRLAHHHRVEPPRTAPPLGVDPVLVAPVDQDVAGLVQQLGGKGSAAHPGDVGLGDADDLVDVPGADPRAGTGPAGHRVGGGHEGIGAVVEVEEGGLGPLEEHVGTPVEGIVEQADGVGHHRGHPGGQLVEVEGADLVGRQGEAVVHLGQDRVLLLQHHVELLAEDLGVEQVLYPEPHPRRLVGVGRSDTALGGAQLVLAQIPLGQLIQLVVVRHDQMSVAADQEFPRIDALGRQGVHLGQQHGRIDHHAVTDDRGDVVVEDPARHQLKGEGLPVHDDGVAGVVATLIADDQLHLLGQEIGQLALALITPLGPDDDGCRHASLLRCEKRITHQCSPHRHRPG